MNDVNTYFAANQSVWNQRTKAHRDSQFYNREGFVKGETVLTPIELNEMGDVNGKTLLHLQCHFGMDSLDWVRRGAVVTGVDFSETAVEEARILSAETNLPASFVCSNIYDLKDKPLGQFDIVFTSYGVIGWLPDLATWAKIIRAHLRKGGIFYLAEFHPVLWMFDDDFTQIKYSYENRELIVIESEGTYTDRNADITGKEYSWNHSISEVLNALIGAGLNIEFFNEYLYAPYPCFRNSVEVKKGQWQIKGLEDKIPMVYSLKAT